MRPPRRGPHRTSAKCPRDVGWPTPPTWIAPPRAPASLVCRCFCLRRMLSFSAEEFRIAGYTASELREMRLRPKELKEGGFTMEEIKNAGFTAWQLRDSFPQWMITGAPLTRLNSLRVCHIIPRHAQPTLAMHRAPHYHACAGSTWQASCATCRKVEARPSLSEQGSRRQGVAVHTARRPVPRRADSGARCRISSAARRLARLQHLRTRASVR